MKTEGAAETCSPGFPLSCNENDGMSSMAKEGDMPQSTTGKERINTFHTPLLSPPSHIIPGELMASLLRAAQDGQKTPPTNKKYTPLPLDLFTA